MTRESTYAAAGVDIDAGNLAVELMSEAVRSTYGPEVLWGIGAFGGLFDVTTPKAAVGSRPASPFHDGKPRTQRNRRP